MSEHDSVWPALQRVYRWAPVQWALRCLAVGATAYAVPWVQSRASRDDVGAVQQQVAAPVERSAVPHDSDGRPITLAARQKADETWRMRTDEDLKACRASVLALRLDLIGFQAASSQPRASLRADTARVARETFIQLRGQLGDDQAYRRALETRPPR